MLLLGLADGSVDGDSHFHIVEPLGTLRDVLGIVFADGAVELARVVEEHGDAGGRWRGRERRSGRNGRRRGRGGRGGMRRRFVNSEGPVSRVRGLEGGELT